MIARLHPCVVGVVELRRCGAMNGQWQVRVLKSSKGGQRAWWPTHYRSALEALRVAARYEGKGMSMRDFYRGPILEVVRGRA